MRTHKQLEASGRNAGSRGHLMTSYQGSSWCCDEAETPRVRTIFRSTKTPAPPAPAPTPTRFAHPDAAPAQPEDWPGLVAAILGTLLPFNGALEAAHQVIREARDRIYPLPAPRKSPSLQSAVETPWS